MSTTRSDVVLGALTLTATNALNVHVAKYDPAGKPPWAQVAGAHKAPVTAASQSIGIAADPAGTSFVSTTFNTPSTVGGTTTLTNKSADDIFLAKYNPAGALAWLRQMGGSAADNSLGLGVDAEGDAVLAGLFNGTAVFGGLTATSRGSSDLFVVSIGRVVNTRPRLSVAAGDGTVVLSWPKTATGFGLESSTAVAGVPWTAISTTPLEAGDRLQVTLPDSSVAQFFRLSK